MEYAIATVEGLHLTCDFAVYSAALYGCPPNYLPTRGGVHEAYGRPYQIFGSIPFNEYDRLALVSPLDEPTLEAILTVKKDQALNNFTCIAFEFDYPALEATSKMNPEGNDKLLKYILARAERILDTLRLFLFKPGESQSIGRVGAIGNGVAGTWIGNEENTKFVARKLFDYQFVQNPLEISIDDVRKIYNDSVFKELHSAGCADPTGDDPILQRIFQSLLAFRVSREISKPEIRFLELARTAEHLAKRNANERLKGNLLRDRIARIAQKSWQKDIDTLAAVTDLWDNVRNALTHSVDTFSTINRDSIQDIAKIEQIVIRMIQAVVLAWRNEQFGIDPYYSLLES